MRTWGYRIATGALLALFGWTWYAATVGLGLPSTAAARAERDAIARRGGYVRTGSYGGRYYGGGGPRFGK
jgi:hypothetical protein